MTVDSHCHVSLGWYEPVETLLYHMDRYDVEWAVLTQMFGQYDNSYQVDCVRRHPDRLAHVVNIDPKRADAVAELERLAEQGARGLRLEATDRSPGDDPLALWHAAARLGMAISCNGRSADFASDDFAELVAALPELTIVIEHLGADHILPEVSSDPIRRQGFALSRFPNVLMKFHGLGEFCRRKFPPALDFPFVQPVPTLLLDALTAFGPQRMMWGSDYPPVSGREGYANALRLPMNYLTENAKISDAERDLMFGGVAQSVFFD